MSPAASPSPSDPRHRTGASGEEFAAAWLEARGWHIVARNWRCRAGEIDLIARDPDGALVACEVKTRRGLGYGDPLEAITWAKLRRLHELVGQWKLAQHEPVGHVRLDALGVLLAPDGTAAVRHVVNVEAR